MRLSITSVDHAPQAFEAATPIDVKVLRRLPGPDRSDYWLGEVSTPFEFTIGHCPAPLGNIMAGTIGRFFGPGGKT